MIHTSDHLGTTKNLGHIDFYVNWGETQSFMNFGYLGVHSHISALKLFLTSITQPELYRSDLHIEHFHGRKIFKDKEWTMGFCCDENSRGMVFMGV